MSFKVSFWKRPFRLIIAIAVAVCFTPSVTLAVNVSTTTVLDSGTTNTNQQRINANDVTLTIKGNTTINAGAESVKSLNNQSGITIIIESGSSITASGSGDDKAIRANVNTNLTITNSGTISADDTDVIKITLSTNPTITNNAGGIITGATDAIEAGSTTNATITNSGTIYITSSQNAIRMTSATGATVTNNAGGEIYNSGGVGAVIYLGSSSTLTNSGTIRNDTSTSNNSIRLEGNDNTVILKGDGIVVGTIQANSGTTGNTLQLQHGFGRAYFYETSGDLTLEDLSGNTVVKGSAGSVSLGGQETVDELLGLRTYNLRSALKRYASAPKPSDEDTVWGETFGYYSKRGGTSSLLKYDTHGYGMTFVHPVKKLVKGLSLTPGSLADKISNQLDFVLSVEHSKLDLPEKHDVERTGFLAGFNASNFASFGNWRASGFAVGGMGWYDSEREILTNTQVTGLLDVTANYVTTEVITGGHISHTYQSQSDSSIKNTWDTEIGFTMGYSRTADYNERHYFFWEERNLVQGSIHLGEQLTTVFNDRLRFTLGGELEHRTVLAGRNQTYRINNASVDYRHGSFYENSVAGNLGLNYSFIDHKPGCNVYEEFCGGSLYIQLNSRLSNETRGTYSGGVGVRLNF